MKSETRSCVFFSPIFLRHCFFTTPPQNRNVRESPRYNFLRLLFDLFSFSYSELDKIRTRARFSPLKFVRHIESQSYNVRLVSIFVSVAVQSGVIFDMIYDFNHFSRTQGGSVYVMKSLKQNNHSER